MVPHQFEVIMSQLKLMIASEGAVVALVGVASIGVASIIHVAAIATPIAITVAAAIAPSGTVLCDRTLRSRPQGVTVRIWV